MIREPTVVLRLIPSLISRVNLKNYLIKRLIFLILISFWHCSFIHLYEIIDEYRCGREGRKRQTNAALGANGAINIETIASITEHAEPISGGKSAKTSVAFI